MTKYGVLLVAGNRTHQEGHAHGFASDPRCRLVAVTDEPNVTPLRAELNRQLAQDFQIPYIADLDEALARDDVHIISVCAPVERRGLVIPKCAAAGKHLYMDKPLAITLADVDAIVAAVEKAGVCSQMQVTRHLSPEAQAAKQTLENGEIGSLTAVHTDLHFAKGKGGTVPEGFVRHEKENIKRYTFVEAKAELSDIGLYMVGLIHWLTGRKTKKVYAMTGNYFFAEHVKCGIEDFGALALTLEGDIIATVTAGRVGWMTHPAAGYQKLTLVGTEGSRTFDSCRPCLEVYNDEPNFVMPGVNPGDPMGMWGSTSREIKVMQKNRWIPLHPEAGTLTMNPDIRAFVDCIEQGREPIMNVQEAAAIAEVILAAYASAARGEEVQLPLPRS